MSDNKSMKIYFLTGVYPDARGFLGGVFIHNQAIALKKRGHDVVVLYLDYRSLRNNRKLGIDKYYIDGILVYRFSFPCGPIYSLIHTTSSLFVKKIYKFAEKECGKPDFVYAHFGNAATNAYSVKRKFKVPYVVIEHDSDILTGKISKRQLLKQKLGYDNADAVIAVSAALKKELQKLTKNTVQIVHNIVPDYMFCGDAKNEKDNSEYIFISVGNLVKSKSFDVTIRAFANVAREKENIKLLIVGSGPEEECLREMVIRLDVQDKVIFKGKIDNKEIPKVLSECNCFVLPAKFETFGVVYVEAMACGMPVIATRCGGPEEFVNEQNGIMVPIDDEQELVKAMQYMIHNTNKYNRKRISNFARVNFSEYSISQKLEEIFLKCID